MTYFRQVPREMPSLLIHYWTEKSESKYHKASGVVCHERDSLDPASSISDLKSKDALKLNLLKSHCEGGNLLPHCIPCNTNAGSILRRIGKKHNRERDYLSVSVRVAIISIPKLLTLNIPLEQSDTFVTSTGVVLYSRFLRYRQIRVV